VPIFGAFFAPKLGIRAGREPPSASHYDERRTEDNAPQNHNIGVAAQIGAYSDAVETGSNLRWLLTSGTPGLPTNCELPSDIAGQAELAWEHLFRPAGTGRDDNR
jgi:enamine deaminase RidA (YjgF/YER057c/UK114 family)